MKKILFSSIFFVLPWLGYSDFIYSHLSEQSVVFDVGAYHGEKTDRYLQLKVKKIYQFEPQPSCINYLKKKYKKNSRVALVPFALNEKGGKIEFYVNEAAPTISTCFEKWKEGRFKDYYWDKNIVVEAMTLDSAINRFGLPTFCKIDVEGFEESVLKGLHIPIPLISFEFTREFFDKDERCIEYLSSLGYEQFNFAKGENEFFEFEGWVSHGQLIEKIRKDPDPLIWGDIYARYNK